MTSETLSRHATLHCEAQHPHHLVIFTGKPVCEGVGLNGMQDYRHMGGGASVGMWQ